MEQIQSTDIYQINHNLDHGFHRTEIPSPHMSLCNSHFFRTKRNQRLSKNQTDINGISYKNFLQYLNINLMFRRNHKRNCNI